MSSALKFTTLQTSSGVEKQFLHAFGAFTMKNSPSARMLENKGVSSLTDLGTGIPQFNLNYALSSAGGWADISVGIYTGTTEGPYQDGARIDTTTTVKGFCGSNTTGKEDWETGYFAVASI